VIPIIIEIIENMGETEKMALEITEKLLRVLRLVFVEKRVPAELIPEILSDIGQILIRNKTHFSGIHISLLLDLIPRHFCRVIPEESLGLLLNHLLDEVFSSHTDKIKLEGLWWRWFFELLAATVMTEAGWDPEEPGNDALFGAMASMFKAGIGKGPRQSPEFLWLFGDYGSMKEVREILAGPGSVEAAVQILNYRDQLAGRHARQVSGAAEEKRSPGRQR